MNVASGIAAYGRQNGLNASHSTSQREMPMSRTSAALSRTSSRRERERWVHSATYRFTTLQTDTRRERAIEAFRFIVLMACSIFNTPNIFYI